MRNKTRQAVIGLFIFTSLLLFLAACGDDDSAENFPNREIEMTIPWDPGGGSDLEGRVVTDYVSEVIGEDMVVVNVPGVGGTIGAEELSQKDANGYHIGQIHDGHLVAYHSGITDINYDDFEPIGSMTTSYQIIAVSSDTGITSLEEFVEYGQENEINFGGTVSGIPRVWLEQVGQELDIQYNLVGYEGLGEAIQALAGGHVEAVIVDYPSSIEFVEAGHMNYIAVGTEERLDFLPDVPTFLEAGYDITFGLNRGYVAPAGTDPEIIQVLSEKFEEAAQNEEFIEEVNSLGVGVNFMNAEEYAQYLDEQNKVIEQTINELDIEE
ncbi:tripartite tricarboxylate transporter substrate binding protein [Virgibacillus sp. YIM 98842]|uniref:Bug family tripartite tricarboxylate transporter substrate binding protein n=1 Tax=Virgibacillus sp. YIM 98842 TaxID=2663533 RepID=UPI0013DD8255|nr:tripartite tricarboxylate transporter substrate binding protein [Virgibacillus sp. YIM 98842]